MATVFHCYFLKTVHAIPITREKESNVHAKQDLQTILKSMTWFSAQEELHFFSISCPYQPVPQSGPTKIWL
jgi:hypothetical protein